jgi:ketosteroid isomerase-like protein
MDEEDRSLAPKKRPGSKPKIDERASKLLEADLKEHPFITLQQRCEYLRAVASVEDVDRLIERFHQAQGEFVKGDPEPTKELFSRKDDVTLANPLGPPARGGDGVAKTIEHAATTIRDGQTPRFETISKLVTPELAYVVWIEWQEAKMGTNDELTPFSLRVTMIFRPEDGEWKIVHRHADPITTPRAAESIIQE